MCHEDWLSCQIRDIFWVWNKSFQMLPAGRKPREISDEENCIHLSLLSSCQARTTRIFPLLESEIMNGQYGKLQHSVNSPWICRSEPSQLARHWRLIQKTGSILLGFWCWTDTGSFLLYEWRVCYLLWENNYVTLNKTI